MKGSFFGRRIPLSAIFGALVVLFFGFSASASPIENARLNPLTTTATRSVEPVAATSVTSPVKVFGSGELKRKGIVTIGDALNRLSEISASSNGVGGLTKIRLFGLPAKYTKIMIDGVDIGDPSGLGAADISNLDSSPVERIEIVEGAQSGLYGSQASAGVINIITKEGRGKPSVTLTQQIGTRQQSNSEISAQGSYKAFRFSGSLSQRYIGGLSKGDFLNGDSFQRSKTEDDPFRNQTGYLNLGYKIDDSNSIKLTLVNIKTISYLDEYPYYEYAGKSIDHSYHVNKLFNAQKIDYIHRNGFLNLDFSFANSFVQRHYKNDPYADSFFKGKRDLINVKADYSISKYVKLSAGGELQNERAKEPDIFSRDREALWIGPSFKKGAFFADAAARVDRYKTFGRHITYKTGIGYNFSTGTTAKVNFGTTFLAPTLYQLYDTKYGNPKLNPEKGKVANITLMQQIKENRISLTAFKTFITDGIDFDFAANPNYFNRSRRITKGMTGTFTVNSIEHFIFNISATWQEAKQKSGGQWAADMERLPKLKINWDMSYFPTSKLSFDLSGRYIGSDRASKYAKFSHKQIGKYSVWNAAVQYRATKNLTLLAKIDNLFDKFYETAEGYQTKPRTELLGLTAKF